jgi:hypothetical protein
LAAAVRLALVADDVVMAKFLSNRGFIGHGGPSRSYLAFKLRERNF